MNRNDAPMDAILTRVTKLVDEQTAKVINLIYAENCIWRELHGDQRPRFSEAQRRRLVKAAMPLKDRLDEFVTLVKPETILRWYRRLKQKKWDYSERRGKGGRQPKPPTVEELVLRMADENGAWGYARIEGEVRKLGYKVDANTVARILKDNGYPIAPERKGMSWKDFIRTHMDVTWAADLFTEEVVTLGGLVTVYVLFFIHLGTRRIHIAGCTPNPNSDWIKQQTRQFIWTVRTPDEAHEPPDDRPACRFVIHDRDATLKPMDMILRSEGVEPKLTPVRAPNANAYAERFVREARETLDNLIIFGQQRLHDVLKKVERHHNSERPHQGIDNRVPLGYAYPEEPAHPDDVRRRPELGGLLTHYYVERPAA